MKYCPKCGSELEEDAAFCPVCGTQLTEIAEENKPKGASDEFMQQFPSYNAESEPEKPRKESKGKTALKIIGRLLISGVIVALVSIAMSVWIPKACSSTKPLESTVLTQSEMDEIGLYRGTMTIYHRGDVVSKTEETYTYILAQDDSEDSYVQTLLDLLQSTFESETSIYDGYDFITCTTNIEDNVFTGTIVMDQLDNTKNIKVLSDMGIVESDGTGLISYKQSIQSLQAADWTLKE